MRARQSYWYNEPEYDDYGPDDEREDAVRAEIARADEEAERFYRKMMAEHGPTAEVDLAEIPF